MAGLVTVLVASDNMWLRTAVQTLIQEAPNMQVVAACTVAGIIEQAQLTRPDVIVLLNGASLRSHQPTVLRLRAEQPQSCILVTTPLDSALYANDPLVAHFDALLEEFNLRHTLLPVINRVAAR
jgi:DNA-binding NarL/FixJ family response regulator